MDEKEIKEILLGPYRTPEYFNKMTVIELCEIMDFCKSSFRNKVSVPRTTSWRTD